MQGIIYSCGAFQLRHTFYGLSTMATSSLSFVNQKLAYARALLKQASEISVPADSGVRLQLQATLDAVVFHLACGFTHYLREVAENYQVKDVEAVHDCSSLQAALAAIDKEPAEAAELSFLYQDTASWVGQMHSYYKSLWSRAPSGEQKRSQDNDSLIPVKIIEVSDGVREVDLDTVRAWERSFTTLISRQRETSSEY